jgi:hypothetical protein
MREFFAGAMQVRTLILLLSFYTLCFGAGISGIWGTDSRSVKPSAAAPVAIRIEQAGDRLYILRIMAGPSGRFLEHRDYLIHRDVEINTTTKGIEVDFYAPAATWMIDSTGALTMRRCGGGGIVLSRSTDVIQ